MTALLELRDLDVRFKLEDRTVHAVRGVSLDLRAGEVLGVVGESGSGKTVTALSLMGLLPASAKTTSSSITFDGRPLDAARLKQIRGDRMAMVFQNPLLSFNPVQRVGAQIGEVLQLHKRVARRQSLIDAAGLLERVGIPEPQKRLLSYPHEFSGGMLQRAMIAMAIACRPAALLADEPTTSLDVTVQAQVLELFASLRSEFGMALMLITHSLAVVANLADRVAVMYAGRVVEQGPVAEVLAAPRHPYTVALLRAVPKLGSVDPLIAIPGQPPDLTGTLTGCAYRDRCSIAGPECEADPALRRLAAGHDAACWKADDREAVQSVTARA
jgi:oligopeptide/dipeptide ABC transporter ATP-binding protein